MRWCSNYGFQWILFCFLCCFIQNSLEAASAQAPYYKSIGGRHYPIGTSSSDAQRFFDQGLLFYYGYHYDDAERAFKEAARLDPGCAMCYFGAALVQGSKSHTKVTGKEREIAVKALKQAKKLVKNNIERAYIEALSKRYSHAMMSKDEIVSDEGRQAYTNAMQQLAQQYPADLEMQVLFVDALMQSSVDEFFIHGSPSQDAKAMLEVLDRVLKVDPTHPGANHYYIHITESSDDPQLALTNANYLDTAHLGIEHLEHMPAHVYMLTGQYHKATLANQRAVKVHHAYQKESRLQGFEPVKNFLLQHDLHFLAVSAMMEGQAQLAIDTARELYDRANEENFSLFYPFPYFALARFGRWEELLSEPKPPSIRPFQLAIWHYVRGLAFLSKGNVEAAQKELKSLVSISNQRGYDVRLKIAVSVLTATIFDKTHNNAAMLKNWKQAVELQDSLGFRHPPRWYFPTREGLASAWLKVGEPQQAEEVLRELFYQYPESGWGLFIWTQVLRAQNKNKEADTAQERFIKAWEHADIQLPIP